MECTCLCCSFAIVRNILFTSCPSVKKRVLDNAATISDQEAESVCVVFELHCPYAVCSSPPKKKASRVRRVTWAGLPTEPSDASSFKTSSKKAAVSKKPHTEEGIPDTSDDISSDDVPPWVVQGFYFIGVSYSYLFVRASILPEPQNSKPRAFKPLFNDSNGSPSPEKSRDEAEDSMFVCVSFIIFFSRAEWKPSISMSSLKLDSGKKPKYDEANVVAASGLLPALSIHAEDATEMSPAPDFETWLELQGKRYKELVESRREKKTTSGEGRPRFVSVNYFCVVLSFYLNASQDDTPSKQKIQGISSSRYSVLFTPLYFSVLDMASVVIDPRERLARSVQLIILHKFLTIRRRRVTMARCRT